MRTLLFILLLPLFLHAEPLPSPAGSGELVIHNRILTKVHGKTISVLDVLKKMDLLIDRNYPDVSHSKVARYHFYAQNWRAILDQMITNELMVADAETHEIKVTDGEVREEIQARFGPNVMANLDRLHLSYEEARKIVHDELVMQRMNWFRVSAKAIQKVGLPAVRSAFSEYRKKNPAKEVWKYQVLTIRSPQEQLAEKAQEILSSKLSHKEEGSPLAHLAATLKQEMPGAVNLSQEFELEDRELSQSHKAVLASLRVGEVSAPTEQKSKDNSTVYRLFHLKEHRKTPPPAFEKVALSLKEELLQTAVDEEMVAYVLKLKSRFGYTDKALNIPEDFKPFTLAPPQP